MLPITDDVEKHLCEFLYVVHYGNRFLQASARCRCAKYPHEKQVAGMLLRRHLLDETLVEMEARRMHVLAPVHISHGRARRQGQVRSGC